VSVLSVTEVNAGAVDPTSLILAVCVYVVVPTVRVNELGTIFSSDRGKDDPPSPVKLEVKVSETSLPSATGTVAVEFAAAVTALVEVK
jgi:hypothetical protein